MGPKPRRAGRHEEHPRAEFEPPSLRLQRGTVFHGHAVVGGVRVQRQRVAAPAVDARGIGIIGQVHQQAVLDVEGNEVAHLQSLVTG